MSEKVEQVARAISKKRQEQRYGREMTAWESPEMADSYRQEQLDIARAAIEMKWGCMIDEALK